MSKSQSKRVLGCAVAAAAALVISPGAFAVDNVWTGATSNAWNDPTNWSLGRVPTNNNGNTTGDTFDDAVINSTTVVPLINTDLAATPRDIITGQGAGNVGQVNHVAGTATTGNGNWFYVGRDAGTGTYNLADTNGTGGTLTHFATGSGSINIGGTTGGAGRLYVGGTEFGAAGAVGTMNINTTGTVAVLNDLSVGTDGGTGVINVDAGTITTGGWNFIGKRANADGGDGTLNLGGGTLTNNGARTFVGLGNSTGHLNITGGATYNNLFSANNDGQFTVGSNNLANPTTPTLTVTNGTLNVNHLLAVGGTEAFGGNGGNVGSGKGIGTVNGPNALVNITGEFWVGNGVGSVGEFNVSAGQVTNNNWIAVGRNGSTGTLSVSGTGVVQKQGNGQITIGTGAGGLGTVNVSENGTLSTNNDLILGENNATAVGVLNQSGGTVAIGGTLDVQRTGIGTYNLSGGTLSVDTNIDAAVGTFAFTGGRITRSGPGVIKYTGDLHVGDKSATLKLNNDKTFVVTGALDIAGGVTLDLTGTTLPGSGAGSFALGTDGSILGTFDPSTTTLVGLATPPGATFISETAGEGGLYNPNTDKVYWVQEQGGNVTLQYSIAPVPEPTFLGFIGLGAVAIVGRRRRR